MYPEFDKGERSSLPRGAVPLSDNFSLLRAAESHAHPVSPAEAAAIRAHWAEHDANADGDSEWLQQPWIAKWDRLLLPTGIIARSVWKEEHLQRVHMARNVKVRYLLSTLHAIGTYEYTDSC